MWQFVRQFCIMLHLVLASSTIGHALPQNRLFNNGIQQLAYVVENPVMSTLKLKLNASNSSSTGKPAMLTISTYSTFSNWDSRTTILQTTGSIINPTMDDIRKAYDKPVIFTTTSKTSPTTKKNGVSVHNPISNSNTKAPTEVKPCQRIFASTLCEDDIDYPVEAARMVFRNHRFNSIYAPYFGNDTMPTKDVINTRFDSTSNDGTPLCSVQENIKLFKPTKLLDKNNTWKYILQQGGDNLSQVIQVEVCSGADRPCNLLSSLSSNYQTKCVQKYAFRKLVWVQDDNRHGVDEFKVPSCCSCRYFPSDEFILSRMSNTKHTDNQKGGG